MNPDHVITLLIVLVVACILYRWGTLILICYALYHFWMQQWTDAGLALIFAGLIAFIKTFIKALTRLNDVTTSQSASNYCVHEGGNCRFGKDQSSVDDYPHFNG